MRFLQETPTSKAGDDFRQLTTEAEKAQAEIAALDEQRESLRKKLERGDGLLNKFLSGANPRNCALP